MSIEIKNPVELAIFIHNKYEELAIKHGWKTQDSCRAKPFFELPKENQSLMIEIAECILAELEQPIIKDCPYRSNGNDHIPEVRKKVRL